MTQKNLDVLFINPRDLVAADPYIKLANIAGVLLQNNFNCEIIEPAASNISQKQIIERIRNKKPLVICIAAFPSTLPDAYSNVQQIKKEFPEIPIVLEGYHVNADAEAVREMGVDYGIIGDGEFTFLKLLQCLKNKTSPPEDLDGLIINQGSKLIINKPALVDDLDGLPLPAYHLLPVGKYYSASTNKKYMICFTTRGCPYNCSFCASPAQMKYRYISNENVLKHVDKLVGDLGVQWIEFMDLTFTISKKRTLEMCDAIIAHGVKFEWGCETRADLVDEEILRKMKEAGCKKITFGVEAGSEKIRYQTGKKITNEKFIKAFDLCRKVGIKTMANFIIGHPNETENELKETVRFAKQLRPFNVFFTRMIPMPDVDIYENGVKNGEITKDIWYKYMRGETGHPVYVPKTLTPALMDKYYKKAYTNFYFSFDALQNYSKLFLDTSFLLRSVPIFLRITFGKPVFK